VLDFDMLIQASFRSILFLAGLTRTYIVSLNLQSGPSVSLAFFIESFSQLLIRAVLAVQKLRRQEGRNFRSNSL